MQSLFIKNVKDDDDQEIWVSGIIGFNLGRDAT